MVIKQIRMKEVVELIIANNKLTRNTCQWCYLCKSKHIFFSVSCESVLLECSVNGTWSFQYPQSASCEAIIYHLPLSV